MTGLRERSRDPHLPGVAGQPELNAPDEAEVRELVGEHLGGPLGAPRSCAWEYARWKPGVSLTCSYAVDWGEGPRTVVLKRYVDGKDRNLADKWHPGPVVEEACSPLIPWAAAPAAGLVLWVYPNDRMLGGLERLLDGKRFQRVLLTAGVLEPGLVRRRKTAFEVLRYKPERRAVVRVRLRLRDEARTRLSLAGRAHAGNESAAIFERRRELEQAGAGDLVPRAVALDAKGEFLLEEWLDVEAQEPDSFDHAAEAGAALGRLHRLAPGQAEVAFGPGRAQDLGDLFNVAPSDLIPPDVPDPAPARPTWVHGDFHPDQVVRARGSSNWMLMDLDLLGRGDPDADLASWIADALHESPGTSFGEASAALLEGYRDTSGREVDPERVALLTAAALVDRAAGSIRRLEESAAARAASALALARSLLRDGSAG